MYMLIRRRLETLTLPMKTVSVGKYCFSFSVFHLSVNDIMFLYIIKAFINLFTKRQKYIHVHKSDTSKGKGPIVLELFSL